MSSSTAFFASEKRSSFEARAFVTMAPVIHFSSRGKYSPVWRYVLPISYNLNESWYFALR